MSSEEAGDTIDAGSKASASAQLSELPAKRAAIPPSKSAAESTPDFSEFYREQMPRLIGFLMTLGADPHRAADVAQESMAATWKHWSRIATPHAYVRTVASHAWGRALAKTSYVEVGLDEFGDDPSGQDGPLDFTIRREEHRTVLARLRALPLRQRQIMAWTYDGYRPAAIANILRLDSTTVRSNLYQARKALKRLEREAE
jgi:RNA polymerase sigma-70 factor (ECF subfamily)